MGRLDTISRLFSLSSEYPARLVGSFCKYGVDMNATVWNEQKLKRLYEMRGRNVRIEDIAESLGVNKRTLERRLYWDSMSPDQRKARRDKIYARRREEAKDNRRIIVEQVVVSERPGAEQIRDRDERMMLAPRDLTAMFCGDPLPGHSALDKRTVA